jgi:hypothetical protein
MPIDACGFRTLRASGVQNPRHDAGRKAKTAQPQAPLLRTATRLCPRTPARGLTAATATPSRRAGPRHGRNLRLPRAVVMGARAASQALLGARTVARLPAPPGSPNEWLMQSRPARRHQGSGESIRDRGARHRDKSGRQRWISTKGGLTRSRSRARGRLVVANSGSRAAQLARVRTRSDCAQATSARGTTSLNSRRRRAATACRRPP